MRGEKALQTERGQQHGVCNPCYGRVISRDEKKADIPMISSPGKVLLLLGLSLAGLGLVMILAEEPPGFWQSLWARLPLGRLPGDIHLHRDGFSFHFPWVTCLVISLAVTILLSLFRK